jgi:hypothetical protein
MAAANHGTGNQLHAIFANGAECGRGNDLDRVGERADGVRID